MPCLAIFLSDQKKLTWLGQQCQKNQDRDKNQMSLDNASAISWALKSTRSPTGSEWSDATEQKLVRPGPDQTGHWIRVGVTGWSQGTPAEIENCKSLGISVYIQPGGLLLVALQGKGVISRVPMWLSSKEATSSSETEAQVKDDSLFKWYS